MNLTTGWTYNWIAKHIIKESGKTSEFDNLTTLRAFTKTTYYFFFETDRIYERGNHRRKEYIYNNC
jgi:hypothetical protein